MATILPWTGAEVQKIIDGRLHSPIQDVVGDNYTVGSPLAVSASTEYDFVSNGNVRNFKVFPDHITNIWDTSTNIATFSGFENTPEIVANVSFMWDPDVAAAGIMTVKVYVNETSPILIKETNIDYKATTGKLTGLLTFYAGDVTGFDVKNKGVSFKIESSAAGNLYDPSIEIYRT